MTRNLRDQNTLICALVYQVSEGLVGHGEDMWLSLFSPSPPVHVDVVSRVDGQRTVGVHGDQE